jgi:broad specificity phosphatase PhoE
VRLLLIRHGQTPSNIAGVLDSAAPGPGLTALGHVQARAIPGALEGQEVVGLYASRLVRTQLTAEPLAHEWGLDIAVRDGLEEIEAGDLEGATGADAVAAYVGTMVAWAGGDLGRPMPGGPSGRDFLERFDAAVRAVAQAHDPDGTVAVVSHGAAIRVWASVRASDQPTVAVQQPLMNTGLVTVEGSPESGWTLVDWREEPLGGHGLEDTVAHDVTGQAPAEAIGDAR